MEKISKAQVKMVRSLQQKKFRDERGLFVAEGEKCVSELSKTFELVSLIVEDGLTSHSASGLTSHCNAVAPLLATRTEIEQMSGLRTPQGVIAVFRKRTLNPPIFADLSLSLALDGIQDPGNLGTIIRTCDWFGVHQIVCSPDTADCYNPKVVQATMGALARVQIHYTDLPQWLSQQSCAIYGTLLDGRDMYNVLSAERSVSEAVCQHSGLSAQRSIIVMGNEGNGISPEVRRLITHPIRIPSYPADAETSESLNVSIATAIVLAEFRRQALFS
jgi:TrmH family RNA methyltransferase